MVSYQDPALPAWEVIVTRKWLAVVIHDITFIYTGTGAIATGALGQGTGQGGYDGLPMPAGALLTAQFGALAALGPPPNDGKVYVLGGDANGQPAWFEKASFYARVKRAALMGRY